MVAMRSMKMTKAERDASEGDGMMGNGSQRDGVPVRLDHDHIVKLGLDGPLPHGTKVEMGGHGEVTESGTHEDVDGEPRHHMTITMTRAGVEPQETASDRRDDLKGDVARAADATARKDAAAGGRADRKIPEERGGKAA
jgi:hypothetical protein